MKNLLILPMVLLLSACEIATPKTTAITILADRTDTKIPKPSIDDILPLQSLEATPNTGIHIVFQNIGDVDYTQVYPLTLASAGVFDNTLQRTSDIRRFVASVDTLLSQQNKQEYDYKRSSILFSVTDHLEKLQEHSVQSNHLILYSDLFEFSDLYDSYANRNIILNNPEKVVEELQQQLTIPNLNSVTLSIKYHPNTPSDNRMFKAWVDIYRLLFKDSGLQIQIGIHKQNTQ